MQKLIVFISLMLSGFAYGQEQADAQNPAPGQACWERTDKQDKPNKYGLVCRDGVFHLASERNRWEDYRNIPPSRAKQIIQAATKEGAACHELRAEKIVVCYWR